LICHHVVHSDCVREMSRALNADGKRYGEGGFGPRAGCPTCGEGTSCWETSKDVGFFPAYWVVKIECAVRTLRPNPPHQPVPVEEIRTHLEQDATIPENQKRYLRTERFDKALKWAGNVRYGGRRIWSGRLFSRGVFKYVSKTKTVWLWEWGDVLPGTPCLDCGRPATIACPGCRLCVETPNYCSAACQEHHLPFHNSICQEFQCEAARNDSG